MEMISIERLQHHPMNPRIGFGDIAELTDSIKKQGILQNLTVALHTDVYYIIIGNRRFEAAKATGLTEVPCEIVDLPEDEEVSLMLSENMQREDLTLYEQAKGFQMMMNLGKTVAQISEMSGFSESTVRRRTKLLDLDEKNFKEATDRGATLFDLAKLDEIESQADKDEVLKKAGTKNFESALNSAIEKERKAKVLKEYENMVIAFGGIKLESEAKYDYEKRNNYVDVDEGKVYVGHSETYTVYNHVDKIEKPDTDKRVFYFVSSGYGVYVYPEVDPDYVAPLTEAQIRANQVKEAQDKFENDVKAKEKIYYNNQIDFIKTLKITKKLSEVIEMYAAQMMNKSFGYISPYVVAGTLKDLTEESYDNTADDQGVAELTAIAIVSGRGLLYTLYAKMRALSKELVTSRWDSDAKMYLATHIESQSTLDLYTFLTAIGYEVPDEEVALLNGTHEIFNNAWAEPFMPEPKEDNTQDNEEVA